MVKGLRPSPMALSESSQESPGSPTPDLEKAVAEPPVATNTLATAPPVEESGVEDEQFAEGSLGFRSNRSAASAKLSSRRRNTGNPDNPSIPTESWAAQSSRAADLTADVK